MRFAGLSAMGASPPRSSTTVYRPLAGLYDSMAPKHPLSTARPTRPSICTRSPISKVGAEVASAAEGCRGRSSAAFAVADDGAFRMGARRGGSAIVCSVLGRQQFLQSPKRAAARSTR